MRWTSGPPLPDTPGYSSLGDVVYGSAHNNVFNVAFCDGSVQPMSYTIDPTVHKNLGNRKDDQPIDAQKLNL